MFNLGRQPYIAMTAKMCRPRVTGGAFLTPVLFCINLLRIGAGIQQTVLTPRMLADAFMR
jgi:hypothetical protein